MLPVWLALPLMVAAALGAGGSTLRLLRLEDGDRLEQGAVAFVLGTGIFGWLVFFLGTAGTLTPAALTTLAVVLALGLWSFRRSRPPTRLAVTSRGAVAFLAAALAFSALCSVIEGLAPPADADSLAYHFTLPKLFLEHGRVFFTERAVDGAIPLLLHMTYAAALGIGGETCLTLWATVTGWAAGAMVFVTARRLMSDQGALAATALFLTTPAVIYGAASGQVEVRNAAFAVLAVLAALKARENRRYAILAGLAGGFFAAAKYTGLVFLGALGVVATVSWRRLAPVALFGLAAVTAGCQWYVWQWLQTGDPVFPMLAGIVPYRQGVSWTPEFQHYFAAAFAASETALPRGLVSFLAYPFLATFRPDPVFDSGRTGFGPLGVVLLVFAAAGAIPRGRRDLTGAGLMFAVAAVFYAAWFFAGPSQRVRHFLPIYPLVILGLLALSQRACTYLPALRYPLAAGIGTVLLIQLGGQAVFAANPMQYVLGHESRDDYLTRNLGVYPAIEQLNHRLGPADRVLLFAREGLYYLDVPFFLAHPMQEAEIDVRPTTTDSSRFLNELDGHGITHVLAERDPAARSGASFLVETLVARGCLKEVDRLAVTRRESRTLGLPGVPSVASLLARTDTECPRSAERPNVRNRG